MPVTTARRRRLILAICCMSLFIVGLDNTIVNVALPSIRTDLHASVSALQWTIDGYTLVLASLLMLSGSTADRVGRARVFTIGLTLFGIGSIACGLAPSVGVLIACRVVQAVGGSMLNPVAMSIIRETFDDPRERARAIGVWAGVVGLSFGLGPVLGGLLVDTVSWRAIFLVNVPVAVAAIVLTRRFVPESRAARPRRLDPVGQLLVLVALAGLTTAVIEGPRTGWGSPVILGCLAASAVAVAVLVPYEHRRRDPLIELAAFRSVPFSSATLIAISAFLGMSGFLFLTTLYLQDVRGLSPLVAGLCLLPTAVMVAVGGPLSGRIVGGRRGARPPLVVGGLGIGLGALMLTGVTPTTSMAWLLLAFAVFGVGFGVVNPPITNAAVAGLPAAQAGVAAAVASTSRQVGASLGVAIVGSAGVAASGTGAQLAAASHVGWWIVAAAGALVLVLGVVATTPRALATARRVA
ncbi:MFS transporter [Patulibacter minatonensis]|uniref:MFS transporter n=1 Tax=Patulibacter minatonensis TaxID=298163 RepID=UPI00047A8D5F|nr:MFS transporter [Patulibacter minatonensis]